MRSNLASAVVVLAAFAASLPGALACGIIGDVCCNVPDNNPNNGDCYEARGVCVDGWCTVDDSKNAAAAGEEECGLEGAQCCKRRKNGAKSARCLDDRNTCQDGTCMKCGVDGAPACKKNPKCEAPWVKKDGMCTADNMEREEDTNTGVCGKMDEACCPDGSCMGDFSTCSAGVCMPCGWPGDPSCPSGPKCVMNLVPNADGLCGLQTSTWWDAEENFGENDPMDAPDGCGLEFQECCDMNENDPSAGRCLQNDGRTTCVEGTCEPCGASREQMCSEKPYCDKGTKKRDGICVPKKKDGPMQDGPMQDGAMREYPGGGMDEKF